MGLNINDNILKYFRFADDMILIAKNSGVKLKVIVEILNEMSMEAGLPINAKKTKILLNNINLEILIEEEKIEVVDEYVYLGQLLSFHKRTKKINKQKNKHRMEKILSTKMRV